MTRSYLMMKIRMICQIRIIKKQRQRKMCLSFSPMRMMPLGTKLVTFRRNPTLTVRSGFQNTNQSIMILQIQINLCIWTNQCVMIMQILRNLVEMTLLTQTSLTETTQLKAVSLKIRIQSLRSENQKTRLLQLSLKND